MSFRTSTINMVRDAMRQAGINEPSRATSSQDTTRSDTVAPPSRSDGATATARYYKRKRRDRRV